MIHSLFGIPLFINITGVKLCKELVGTPSMKMLEAAYAELPSSACPGLEFDSDDYWRCVIRARAQPAARPVGTCKMGGADDPLAVTDPHLRFVFFFTKLIRSH